MGTKAFTNFLISIQGHIGTPNNTVEVLEQRVKTLTARSEAGGPDAQQPAGALVETQRELEKTRTAYRPILVSQKLSHFMIITMGETDIRLCMTCIQI